MSESQFVHCYFLPYYLRGLATGIRADATGERHVIDVNINIEMSGVPQTCLIKPVSLLGPGDILGFCPSIVSRTDPVLNVGDFESNFFPTLDFTDADFPWRFTPKAETDSGSVDPWVTLVALISEDRDEIEREFTYGEMSKKGILPWIIVKGSALPKLSESWRWAHVQLTSDESLDNDDMLAAAVHHAVSIEPERIVSRLICARKLRPGVAYTAFVVPTFALGRQAGRGEDFGENPDASEYAWQPGEGEIQLPYYYKWEFRTGQRGDFEYLVRLLQPKQLKGLGTRPANCSNPGFGLGEKNKYPPSAGFEDMYLELQVEGALKTQDTVFTEWGKDPKDENGRPIVEDISEFTESLATDVLNKPRADLISTEQDPPPTPMIAPPVYGRWHAAVSTVKPDEHHWFSEINLDPRHRFAAGLGAAVVRKEQERLMASAWDQVGEVERANELLKQAQLGCEISKVTHERLGWFPMESFLHMGAPVASRTMVSTIDESDTVVSMTAAEVFRRSPIPKSALSPSIRRALRSQGPLRRRQKSKPLAKGGLLQRLNTSDLNVVGPHPTSPDMVSLEGINQKLLEDAFNETNRVYFKTAPESVYRSSFEYIVIVAAYNTNKINLFCLKATKLPRWLSFNDKVLNYDHSGEPRIWVRSVLRLNGKHVPFKYEPEEVQLEAYFNVIDDDDIKIIRVRQSFWITVRPAGDDRVFICSRLVRNEVFTPNPGMVFTRETFYDSNSIDFTNDPDAIQTIGALQSRELPKIEEVPSIALETVQIDMLEALRPETTIGNRTNQQLHLADGDNRTDPLDLIMTAPEFPTPMYKFLKEMSQDLLLPGLEKIPQNSISLLETNNRFIESYMCGLNHEFSSELLFREYPTDQRGSYFRQFWDVRDFVPSDDLEEALLKAVDEEVNAMSSGEMKAAIDRWRNSFDTLPDTTEEAMQKAVRTLLYEEKLAEHLKDITPLHTWRGNYLGTNGRRSLDGTAPDTEAKLVLSIRGELLKKYPKTTIYMVRGVRLRDSDDAFIPALHEYLFGKEDPGDDTPEACRNFDLENAKLIGIIDADLSEVSFFDQVKLPLAFPIFKGALKPDITFLGFDLTIEEAMGNADDDDGGWYFVIEERVSEPRFGLDMGKPTELLLWNDLAWGSFADITEDNYINGTTPETPSALEPDAPEWKTEQGTTASGIAHITMQKPVRIVIHTAGLLPK